MRVPVTRIAGEVIKQKMSMVSIPLTREFVANACISTAHIKPQGRIPEIIPSGITRQGDLLKRHFCREGNNQLKLLEIHAAIWSGHFLWKKEESPPVIKIMPASNAPKFRQFESGVNAP